MRVRVKAVTAHVPSHNIKTAVLLTFGMTKMPSVLVGCFSNWSSVSYPFVSSPNTCTLQNAGCSIVLGCSTTGTTAWQLTTIVASSRIS